LSDLDRRLNAFRPDLADSRLRGQIDAADFTPGRAGRVIAPVVNMQNAPRPDAGLDTQLLMGDEVMVFDEAEGFAWVQAKRDFYVGYVSDAALAAPADAATHVVAVPRSFVYREPDMKKGATSALSLGSRLTVVDASTVRGTDYAILESGEAVVANHLAPVGNIFPDFVSVAERLEWTPYLWGGTSAFGIDCSGLVQLSMCMAGRDVLRDTDMQEGSIGEPLDIGDDLAGLRRGDLVFWKGHVAIMMDERNTIHANGHTMTVSRELLADAVARIAYLYGKPTAFRRP
jgi:cell wall-associated NlpC family hydrolase